MSSIPFAPQQNQLLAALSGEALNRLYSHLEIVALQNGEVLYESGYDRRHVYFPVDCIVSLLHDTENGDSAEISMVGNEGVLGITSLMSSDGSPWRAVVQNAGFAYRLTCQRMRGEFERHGEMLQLILRYTQSRIVQMSQTAVCNRHHSIDQQVCRWLLQTLDRLRGSTINITQELLGNALGVRREGVTVAAGKLQQRGIIEYSRGKITVLERDKLEALSCECYGVVTKEMGRLLPRRHEHANALDWAPEKFQPAIGRVNIRELAAA
ncbi:MAG: Crp/Fnr family transcriptional regulator [Arenimonas sp.]